MGSVLEVFGPQRDMQQDRREALAALWSAGRPVQVLDSDRRALPEGVGTSSRAHRHQQ